MNESLPRLQTAERAARDEQIFAERGGGKGLALLLGFIAACICGAAAATQNTGLIALAAGLLGVAGTVFAFRHPDWLLWTLILSAPLTDYLSVNLGGTNIRPYGPLTILGVFCILWQFFSRKQNAMRGLVVFYRGTLAILFLYFASKVMTVYSLTVLPPRMTKEWVLKFVFFVSSQMTAGFVCAAFIGSLEQLKGVLRIWIHIANVICFVAFVQIVISNTTGMNFVWDKDLSPLGRPYSVFREPDVLGCFHASILMLLFPLLVSGARFINRPYMVLTFAAHSFFLLLGVVRAAWIASLICVGLYAVFSVAAGRFRRIIPYANVTVAAMLGGAIFAILFAPAQVEKMTARFSSVANPHQESASAYRLMELTAQSDMAFNPRYGTGGNLPVALGYGDFSWTYWGAVMCPPEQYAKLPEGGATDGFTMALAMYFDNGIVGMTLGCAFYLALMFNFLGVLRQTRDPVNHALLCGSYLAIVAPLICYQFSNDPLFLSLWIMMGFHLAIVYHVSRANAEIESKAVTVKKDV